MGSEIRHHGVIGQKWGVRRYQNKDGSLTPAGKRRADKGFKDSWKLAEKHATLEDSTRRVRKGHNGQGKILVTTNDKKEYKRQLDDFIRTNEIMNKKYSDVISEVYVDKGKAYVQTILIDRITGDGYQSIVELHEND